MELKPGLQKKLCPRFKFQWLNAPGPVDFLRHLNGRIQFADTMLLHELEPCGFSSGSAMAR